MRGHNIVLVSGNVGGPIVAGQTRDNNPACSFSLAAEELGRGTTWVRINVYGALAQKCQQNVSKGLYVSIIGELMNRQGKHGELTEVRARDILFFPTLSSDSKEANDGPADT